MAEPLRENRPTVPENLRDIRTRSSADVPTFDTYPAEPPRDVDWKGRRERWRAYDARNPNPTLNETAEKIGSAVGDMVNRAQEARRRFDLVKRDVRKSSGSKMEDIKQRAQDAWSSATEAAQKRLEDWKQSARRSAEDARNAVVQRTREARVKTRAYVNENPHLVILAIAGAAFVLGITARIWRSQRD
jgi:ElaB/YqjD/DUF883 family membrane-anchored ribosome-binding protein